MVKKLNITTEDAGDLDTWKIILNLSDWISLTTIRLHSILLYLSVLLLVSLRGWR